MAKQHDERMPTWAIVAISVVIALVLGIIIYGWAKKAAWEKLNKDIRTGVKEVERTVREDAMIVGSKVQDEITKAQTGTDSTTQMLKTDVVATSDELQKLIDGKRALNCRVTNVRTGQVAIYQADDNFEKVRFEDGDGGVIIDDNKMYVWDNKTMTGVKIKVDMSGLTGRMMRSTGAAEVAAGQNIVVSCTADRKVDLSRPKDIKFDETIKISD